MGQACWVNRRGQLLPQCGLALSAGRERGKVAQGVSIPASGVLSLGPWVCKAYMLRP